MDAYKEAAYEMAKTLGGDAGVKLLVKRGLGEVAVDCAIGTSMEIKAQIINITGWVHNSQPSSPGIRTFHIVQGKSNVRPLDDFAQSNLLIMYPIFQHFPARSGSLCASASPLRWLCRLVDLPIQRKANSIRRLRWPKRPVPTSCRVGVVERSTNRSLSSLSCFHTSGCIPFLELTLRFGCRDQRRSSSFFVSQMSIFSWRWPTRTQPSLICMSLAIHNYSLFRLWFFFTILSISVLFAVLCMLPSFICSRACQICYCSSSG